MGVNLKKLAQTDRLRTDFSIYLDLVRFLAAALVVLSHMLTGGLLDAGAGAYVPELGRESVIIFFVLSGFVIKFTVDQKHPTLEDYVVARCARIYSVALPVLAGAFVIGAIVLRFTSVDVSGAYQLARAYFYFPFHLLFAGEFWNLSETPPWLVPYWSLGYEVWYYVVFGAAHFTKGALRIALVAAILMLVGFKLWLLLPIWLSGVWLYQWLRSNTISGRWALAGWILSFAGLWAYKAFDIDIFLRALGTEIWPFPALRLGSADRYLSDYVVCLFVFIQFACAANMRFPNLLRFGRPIRSLAAHTFTLYLVHNLVLMVWKSFYPHDPANPADVALVLCAVGVATYLVGFVTERRKGGFERLFRGLYQRAHRAVVPANAAAVPREPICSQPSDSP